jgi:hypothetical protein
MTVKVFRDMPTFVGVAAGLQVADGGIMCSSYLPSSLFPKDSVEVFFTQKQSLDGATEVTRKLWESGKALYRSLRSGRWKLLVEERCLISFVNDGLVHEGVPDFEQGHKTRIAVLRRIRTLAIADSIVVVAGPVPFVFRLVPPSEVLIDVRENLVSQSVQGILLDDLDAYAAFSGEASRLENEDCVLRAVPLADKCEASMERLKLGRVPFWSDQ